MFNLTRQEAANELQISTRSIDRYVKSGKLRSEKRGKVVYVSNEDVSNLISGSSVKQEVIMSSTKSTNSSGVVKHGSINSGVLDTVYTDLKDEIKQKDEVIQDLSVKLGRAEEIAKNSVSLIDFKKSQFLLEESKGHLNNEMERLEKDKITLSKDLKYEKNSNRMLVGFVILLLLAAGFMFFYQI